MRNALVLVPCLLAACAAAPAPPPARSQSGAVCRSENLGRFAGREATSAVGSEILRASGAKVLRWVQPGMMVTMDYREDRVTVWLAPASRIERVSCG